MPRVEGADHAGRCGPRRAQTASRWFAAARWPVPRGAVFVALGAALMFAQPARGLLDPGTTGVVPPPRLVAATPGRLQGETLAAALRKSPGKSLRDAAPLGVALADAFGPVELALVDRRETPKVLYGRFRQTLNGIPVLGTSVIVSETPEGLAALVQGRWFRSAAASTAEGRAARVTAEQARETLLLAIESGGRPAPDRQDLEWAQVEQAWLPVAAAADTAGRSGPRFRLVWSLELRTGTPPGRWEGWVDAQDGRLLGLMDRAAYAEVSGRVFGSVELSTVGDPRQTVPFADLAIQATQQTHVAHDTTDTQGAWSVDLPLADRARLAMELRGARVWVRNASAGLSTPYDTLSVIPPGPVDLVWDDGNSSISDRDAYFHVGRAHAAIRSWDGGSALAALDRPMQVRVEDESGACNAYWNGSRLNFYAAGSGCVSAARVADVVYHEYGHAVTDRCYLPYSVPGDMGEAFSDYFAATLTDQPFIGNAFYGPGTWIREIDRDRIWPEDASPSIHQQGLILAGALWDLRERLGASLTDPLFHFARYAAAQGFDDYLLDVLVQDDDNGDLDDGTPHFAEIIGAFRAHGIGDYAVRIDHTRLPDLESPPAQIATEATVRSLLALDPDSVFFAYSTGGEFTSIRPGPAGETRRYRAEFPAPPAGSAVRYYWFAADTAGHRATLPPGAPAECFTFLVGPDLRPPEIIHEPLGPVTADLARISLHAAVSDNSDQLGEVRAIVRRADSPDSASAPLEPHVAPDIRRAEPPLPALSVGDTLIYRLEAADRALQPNQTRWPERPEWWSVAVLGGRTVDFESGPGEFTPDGGWSWGSPAAPIAAWSGRRAWGVTLAGNHGSNLSATLALGPVDLRDWDRARLELRHLYQTEVGYDGGRVEWSGSEQGPWSPLTPIAGYPTPLIRTLEGPGFDGDSDGWRRDVFPLDAFLGETVWLRFRFESDARVEGRGWFVDDVALIAAQAAAPPGRLRAEECGADCIDLTWAAPAEIDTASARFLGYRLARAEEGGDIVELFDAPFRARHWIDRGLVTGRTYHYRLRAVYDEGESEARTAATAPFAPALELPVLELVHELRAVASGDTSFLISNSTGGTLRFNTYLGDSAATLESLRLRCPRDSSSAWRRLWSGPDEPGANPQVVELAARNRLDPEIGPLLELRLRGERSWGSPDQDWGGLIWIDTDDNLATGRPDNNLGAEFLVAFGRHARSAGFDGPAVLLSPALRPLHGLTGALLPAGADSVLIAIPWQLIGLPPDVRLKVSLAADLAADPWQEIPPPGELDWIAREPRHGRAEPGHPQPCEVSFDATTGGNGTYRAVLVLESNDIEQPARRIPITLHVRDLLPSDVGELKFHSADRGLEGSFRLPLDPLPLGALIERSEAEPIRWSQLSAEPATVDSSGFVRFLDDMVEPGREYLYRFRVGFAPQRFVTYGPYRTTYRPAVAAALALSAPRPNPLRSTQDRRAELRADLPESGEVRVEVFDAAGRRVRRLVSARWGAGPHWVGWDGRNDAGDQLPSGSYWIAFSTSHGTRARRLVILH